MFYNIITSFKQARKACQPRSKAQCYVRRIPDLYWHQSELDLSSFTHPIAKYTSLATCLNTTR
jgi:hypothetical protein